MVQDPYKYIKSVYDSKIGYENAITDEEKKKHNAAANKARQMLRDYGYGDIADSISADGATAEKVKSIMDLYGKKNKTSTRKYMYSLGKAYGMSDADVDKLISWDNTTGEVSFGGKKIGTPDSVVDGVSYWNDTSVLDNAFKDYIDRAGITRETPSAVNQENEKLFAKYNKEYDYLLNTNPFKTEVGKAILAKYDLAGLQGRDNAVAENAGSNGGNIDSFAAANALRQQTELVNQGQMVALDAHQKRLDHARSLLSDMGVNIDRVFAQNETKRINDANIESQKVDDKVKITGVSGYTPDEWVVSNNPYMNDDGTIKSEYKNIDFSTVMEKAKENGNPDLYNAAATARFYKIMGDYGKYGQYDDGNYMVPGAKKTQAAVEHDDEVRLEDKALDVSERVASAQNDNALAVTKQEGANAIAQINAQTQGEKEIIKETAKYTNDGGDDYAAYNVLLSMWPVGETEKRAFIEGFIKPIYEGKETITPEGLKQLILTNTEKYNIDVDDATKICQAFNVSTDWLNQYRDRTKDDGSVTWYDESSHEGQYGGMVKK